MNINVHIDRLVLHEISIPYHSQSLLQKAAETELARLFTTKGPANGLKTSVVVSHISASDIQLADEINPIDLGQHIGRVVHERINR